VDTLFYTKIDEKKILAKFLFYKLKNEKLEDLNVGSAVPSLTTEVLNQFTIFIPPLYKQQTIVSLLSCFDDKIELLREQNKILEKTAQTIFQEWFGKYEVDNELPAGWRTG
jgi:type I restriction enzyme S subunit